jgi:hypothetical protein
MIAQDGTTDFADFEKLGWPFILVVFVFFCFGQLLITALRHRFGIETIFRRPSIDRTPFNRRDILQVFRLYWVSGALTSLGACLALLNADHNGVMMFWPVTTGSAGLFIGERIVYLVYAKRIT